MFGKRDCMAPYFPKQYRTLCVLFSFFMKPFKSFCTQDLNIKNYATLKYFFMSVMSVFPARNILNVKLST